MVKPRLSAYSRRGNRSECRSFARKVERVAVGQPPARFDADKGIHFAPQSKKRNFGKVEHDAMTESIVLQGEDPRRAAFPAPKGRNPAGLPWKTASRRPQKAPASVSPFRKLPGRDNGGNRPQVATPGWRPKRKEQSLMETETDVASRVDSSLAKSNCTLKRRQRKGCS